MHFIIKGQISIKTAIVREWLENNQVLSFQSGFRDLKNDRIWCYRFFQTEQTVNRKKSGFRAAHFCPIPARILWFSLSLHKDKVRLENSYDILHRFRVLQVYPSRIFTWHPIHQNYWNHAHKIETLIWTWFEIFYELSYPELHDLRNSYYTIKFGYSEKATKFEKIFHLKFDATQ